MTDYKKLLDDVRKNKPQSSLEPNSKILIVDGLNTYIRGFAANPSLNEDGIHVGGITGFLQSVGYAIRSFRPTRCIVVFDGKGGSSRRRKIYPDYKGNRKPTQRRFNRAANFEDLQDERQSMNFQFRRVMDYLSYFPITILVVDNTEADDIIAYVSNDIFTEEKNKCIIMSTDKDFLQLVDDRVSVWSPTKKKLYTPDSLYEEFGLFHYNYIMYKVLQGDKSDNIPGIKGSGHKTLQKRLPFLFESNKVTLNQISKYSKEHINEVKFYQNISNSKSQLELNYKLMQLHDANMSGKNKLNVLGRVHEPISRLVKYKVITMSMEDKIYSILRNIESWTRDTFNQLDIFAGMTHGST